MAQDIVYVVVSVNLDFWPLLAIMRYAKIWESRRWERINAIIRYTALMIHPWYQLQRVCFYAQVHMCWDRIGGWRLGGCPGTKNPYAERPY
jgi:hypothetical protein